VDEALASYVIGIMPVALVLHLAIGSWMYSNEALLPSEIVNPCEWIPGRCNEKHRGMYSSSCGVVLRGVCTRVCSCVCVHSFLWRRQDVHGG
jgi:hypothetical protein